MALMRGQPNVTGEMFSSMILRSFLSQNLEGADVATLFGDHFDRLDVVQQRAVESGYKAAVELLRECGAPAKQLWEVATLAEHEVLHSIHGSATGAGALSRAFRGNGIFLGAVFDRNQLCQMRIVSRVIQSFGDAVVED